MAAASKISSQSSSFNSQPVIDSSRSNVLHNTCEVAQGVFTTIQGLPQLPSDLTLELYSFIPTPDLECLKEQVNQTDVDLINRAIVRRLKSNCTHISEFIDFLIENHSKSVIECPFLNIDIIGANDDLKRCLLAGIKNNSMEDLRDIYSEAKNSLVFALIVNYPTTVLDELLYAVEVPTFLKNNRELIEAIKKAQESTHPYATDDLLLTCINNFLAIYNFEDEDALINASLLEAIACEIKDNPSKRRAYIATAKKAADIGGFIKAFDVAQSIRMCFSYNEPGITDTENTVEYVVKKAADAGDFEAVFQIAFELKAQDLYVRGNKLPNWQSNELHEYIAKAASDAKVFKMALYAASFIPHYWMRDGVSVRSEVYKYIAKAASDANELDIALYAASYNRPNEQKAGVLVRNEVYKYIAKAASDAKKFYDAFNAALCIIPASQRG